MASKRRYRDREKARIYARHWRAKNPGRRRELDAQRRRRWPTYWIDRNQTRQEAKAGRPKPDRCEVCGGTDGGIAFDHCHQRGIFRGWICAFCNTILGLAKDDPNRLLMLVAYLERTKGIMPPQLTLPL